jgi:cell division protein FtsL
MSKLLLQSCLQSFKEKLYQEDLGNFQLKNRNKVIILTVLIIFCGVLYLWQINSLATKGYNMKDLEAKASELKDENKRLQVQITDLRSVARITEKVQELKMVEVARLEYLKANGSTVALNR